MDDWATKIYHDGLVREKVADFHRIKKWYFCTYEKSNGRGTCDFFGTLPAMNEHFASHTNCYEFRCGLCLNGFVTQTEFAKHKGHGKCPARYTDLKIEKNHKSVKKNDMFLRSIFIREATEDEQKTLKMKKDSGFHDWNKGPKNGNDGFNSSQEEEEDWDQDYQDDFAHLQFPNWYNPMFAMQPFLSVPPPPSLDLTFSILPPPPPPPILPPIEASRDQSTGIDPKYLSDEWHMHPEPPPENSSETVTSRSSTAETHRKDSVASTQQYGTSNSSPIGSEQSTEASSSTHHRDKKQSSPIIAATEIRQKTPPIAVVTEPKEPIKIGTSETVTVEDWKRKRPAPGSLGELIQEAAIRRESSETQTTVACVKKDSVASTPQCGTSNNSPVGSKQSTEASSTVSATELKQKTPQIIVASTLKYTTSNWTIVGSEQSTETSSTTELQQKTPPIVVVPDPKEPLKIDISETVTVPAEHRKRPAPESLGELIQDVVIKREPSSPTESRSETPPTVTERPLPVVYYQPPTGPIPKRLGRGTTSY